MQNAVVGTDLSEWHSGYRAYSVKALESVPFERNADGFNFDTQIIVQMHEAGRRIAEVPIPTYYGDEICYVDGVKYAKDRSEEHTSELQSLMRISYAVFCLKQKHMPYIA